MVRRLWVKAIIRELTAVMVLHIDTARISKVVFIFAIISRFFDLSSLNICQIVSPQWFFFPSHLFHFPSFSYLPPQCMFKSHATYLYNCTYVYFRDNQTFFTYKKLEFSQNKTYVNIFSFTSLIPSQSHKPYENNYVTCRLGRYNHVFWE